MLYRNRKFNKKLKGTNDNRAIRRKRSRNESHLKETMSKPKPQDLDPDPTKVKSLTEVNGKKYLLFYEFPEDNEHLWCGYFNCDFKLVKKSVLESTGADAVDPDELEDDEKMMNHVNEVHFFVSPVLSTGKCTFVTYY